MDAATTETSPPPYKFQLAKVRHCERTKLDISISYEAFGQATNPTLLLVMGLNGQALHWDEAFCQKLADAGPFYVIRYDHRDVGESTKCELGQPPIWKMLLPYCLTGDCSIYSLHDMAQDAIGLLDALKIKAAHVVGASMGGMIAQEMAIHFPDRVLSLCSIMSTTGTKDLVAPPFWVKLEFLKAPKSNSIEDIAAFRVAFSKKVLQYGLQHDDEYLKRRAEIVLRRSTYKDGLSRQMFAIHHAPNREPWLKKLKTPTTVIHGLKDVLVDPSHGYRTAAVIPGAKMVAVENMGHAIPQSLYDFVVREIVELSRRTS